MEIILSHLKEPIAQVYENAFSLLSLEDTNETAKKLYDHFLKSGGVPTTVLLIKFFEILLKDEEGSRYIFRVYQDLKSRGIILDFKVYQMVLRAAEKLGEVSQGEAVFYDAIDANIELTPLIFNPLIRLYCSLDSQEKLGNLLYLMQQKNVHFDVGSYTPLMKLDKSIDSVAKLISRSEMLLESGQKLDRAFFISLLKNLHTITYPEAEKLLGFMLKNNVQLDVVVFGVLSKKLAQSHRFTKDEIKKFQSIGKKFNVEKSISTLILDARIHARNGNVASFKDVSSEICQNFSPNQSTINRLNNLKLYCYLNAKKYENCFDIFDEMKRENQVDVATYTVMFSVLSKQRDDQSKQKITDLSKEVKDRGIQPNIFLCTEMIRAFVLAEKEEECLEVYFDMLKSEIKPNANVRKSLKLLKQSKQKEKIQEIVKTGLEEVKERLSPLLFSEIKDFWETTLDLSWNSSF